MNHELNLSKNKNSLVCIESRGRYAYMYVQSSNVRMLT